MPTRAEKIQALAEQITALRPTALDLTSTYPKVRLWIDADGDVQLKVGSGETTGISVEDCRYLREWLTIHVLEVLP